MRIHFFFIALAGLSQVAIAQPGASIHSNEITVTSPSLAASPSVSAFPVSVKPRGEDSVRYLDYKSMYEAESLEEKVKMAAARFKLTSAQQEI